MSKLVKVHNPANKRAGAKQNPSLALVNPYGKPARKKRRNPSSHRNPDVIHHVLQFLAAGAGALGTTLIANMLPLPTNQVMNGVAKGIIGGGLGYAASKVNLTKNYAVAIGAGGVGMASADTIRNLVPQLRTIFVPTLPAAEAVKEASDGQISDVVVDELMGDVIDNWPYAGAEQYAA